MSTPLPPSPNLEQLRKQAKDLRSRHRSRDPEAARRLIAASGKFARSSADEILASRIPLAGFQHALAVEYGFRSWPDLKEAVIAANLDLAEAVKAFIDAAMRGKSRFADRLVEKHPGIATHDLATAATLGDRDKVAAALAKDPEAVNGPCGPFPWPPIVYAVRSCLGTDAARQTALRDTVALLLERGADPNFQWPCPFPGPGQWDRQPLLYAAVGIANNAPVTRLLLEAGAEPNDGESLYHSAEHRDLDCMRVLLEAGADPNRTPVLHRSLDYDDKDAVDLLLGAGADPNFREQTPEGIDAPLVHAIKHQASEGTLRALLQAGATRAATGHPDVDLVHLCARYGVDPGILGLPTDATDPGAELITACAKGDADKAHRLAADPTLLADFKRRQAGMLPEMAKLGNAAAVRVLLDIGVDLEVKGDWGGTALHQAAWLGHAEVVEAILRQDPELEGVNDYGGTALGTVLHGSVNAQSAGDYQTITELLLDKGARILPQHIGMGSDDCDELVREGQA